MGLHHLWRVPMASTLLIGACSQREEDREEETELERNPTAETSAFDSAAAHAGRPLLRAPSPRASAVAATRRPAPCGSDCPRRV